MPDLRSGVRRGRPPKQAKREQQVQADLVNTIGQGEGIATRTRRRRAAAAAAAAIAQAPAVNENVAVPAQPVEPVVEIQQPVRLEREEVAEKPMDDLSGGKSGAKANAGDDDGVNTPVPDSVIYINHTHFISFVCDLLNNVSCFKIYCFLLSLCDYVCCIYLKDNINYCA